MDSPDQCDPVVSTDSSGAVAVLIVDDHCLIRQGLARIVTGWNEHAVVHEADSVTSALAACASTRFDFALMDLGLPDQTGMVLLSKLRAFQNGVVVAVVSEHEDAAIVARCMDFGATAFIPKSAPFTRFEQALLAVLERRWSPPESRPPRREATLPTWNGKHNPFGLTPREGEVLNWLSRGYSNKRIAKEVGVVPGTVKVHVSGIMKKMHVQSRGEAIARFANARLASMSAAQAAP